MKFLLTSAGITNQSIAGALFDLTKKPANETNVVFIPTAANVEAGDKSWLVEELEGVNQLGFESLDIVDVSALPQDNWQPRLEAADVLIFAGGNTYHLIHWVKKSGLADLLPELLESRVYVGISAGSMIVSNTIDLHQSNRLYDEDVPEQETEEGLGFFPFHILPHLNSPYFPKVTKQNLEETGEASSDPTYVLDDSSALKIDDGIIEIVSEGKTCIL